MELKQPKGVLNVMDTNGRRSDSINAYTIFLNCLQSLRTNNETEWGTFPKSLSQYEYYKAVVEQSPDKLKRHDKWDELQTIINNYPDLGQAFFNKNQEKVSELSKKYGQSKFIQIIRKGVEDRARHYTSNLVKIGFTNKNREISAVGNSYLNGKNLNLDNFEKLLPIKTGNLIFLRQLMKLKVYTKKYDFSYNPMMMAFYLLLNTDRISQSVLLNTTVCLSPYSPIDPAKVLKVIENNPTVEPLDFILNYIDFTNTAKYEELSKIKNPLDKKTFSQYIKNGKGSKYTGIYYQFYQSLLRYKESGDISQLFKLYSDKNARVTIDRGFSLGKGHVFKWVKDKENKDKFFNDNSDSELLNTDNLNTTLYICYMKSNRVKNIHEYNDTFRRLLQVSGIVSFDNGIAELMYKDLWKALFSKINFEKNIFQKYNTFQSKQAKKDEDSLSAEFRQNIPITKILNILSDNEVVSDIKKKFNVQTQDEVKNKLLSQKDEAFKEFVKNKFPKDKVLDILKLFEDRSNDKKIKQEVNKEASVPTIYEYITGLAWYYVSDDKDYNLYDSFNLLMNADFRPETHAGGGECDIVINYTNDVLMLEVTLMNKQAQKRGEWEPVLRHATNLTAINKPKKVRTLFIADELDENTINIWRAVASVPMRPTRNLNSDTIAENVTIMPIKNEEMCQFLEDEKFSSKKLMSQINKSFEKLKRDFDDSWRDKILSKVYN